VALLQGCAIPVPPVTPWKSPAQEIPKRDECVGGDWGEVETRYPYRKVGVDHLLSFLFCRALLTLSKRAQKKGRKIK
jgi:hypothetical protein